MEALSLVSDEVNIANLSEIKGQGYFDHWLATMVL